MAAADAVVRMMICSYALKCKPLNTSPMGNCGVKSKANYGTSGTSSADPEVDCSEAAAATALHKGSVLGVAW